MEEISQDYCVCAYNLSHTHTQQFARNALLYTAVPLGEITYTFANRNESVIRCPAVFEEQHRADSVPGSNSLFQGKQPHKAAQPEKAGSRVCAAGIRKGKVLRAVQGSQGRTAQTENRKAECCVLFPGGRTDAAGEIKECAYDQSENRSGVPVPDSSSDR